MTAALAWTTVVAAQGTSLTELTKDAVIGQARDTAAVRAGIDERLDTLRAQHDERDAEVTAASIEVQAFVLPEPPETVEGLVDVATAQAAVDTWSARIEARERLVASHETLAAAARARREVMLLLAQEADLSRQWAEESEPLTAELGRRLAEGTLTPEDLPAVFLADGGVIAAGRPGDYWRDAAARDRLLTESSVTEITALAEDNEADRLALARARASLASASVDAALRAEVGETPLGDLQVRFTEAQADLETRREVLVERRDGYLVALSAFDDATIELENVGADLEKGAADSTQASVAGAAFASLRAAEQARESARVRLEIAERRRTGIDTLSQALSRLVDAEATYVETSERVIDAQARMTVLAESILDQGGEISGVETMRRDLSSARGTLYDLVRQASTRAAQGKELDDLRSEAEAALSQATANLETRTAALEREREWARFLEDAEALDNAGLVAAFEESRGDLDGLSESAAEIADAGEKSLSAMREAEAALTEHYNPIGVAVAEDADAFTAWRGTVGLAARAEPDKQPDGAETPAPAAGDEAQGKAPKGSYVAELATTRSRLETVSKRLEFYRREAELRELYLQALDQAAQAVTLTIDGSRDVLGLTRRVWGAAAVLRQRAEDGSLPASDLPAEVEEWGSRERVVQAQEELDRLEAILAEIAAAKAALEREADPAVLVPPLEGIRENLASRIEALVSLDNFEAQFLSLDDLEALDELQARLLEKEVVTRIETDHGVYGMLDDFFASDQLTDIDDLLRRYYQRLILLERQIANIENQQAQLGLVREATEASREALEGIREVVLPERDAAQGRLALRTTAVRAALAPEEAGELIADLEARTGRILAPADVPAVVVPEGAEDREAAVREAREALVRGLVPDWSLAEGYARWVAFLDDTLAPLGRLDANIALLDDLGTRLENQRAELQRRVQRLIGIAPESLGTEQEGSSADRRFLAGEIGSLRVDREATIEQRAIESSVSLVVIPVIALILLFIGRALGWRFFLSLTSRGVAEDGKAKAEQRANTLFGIFSSAWSILVVVLAVIYMLQAVNVDITPLVASLGIFGLAVAFGAQAIMKDVFSGFFLLMENQLNKGEWVVVNGILAEVEEIGLRVTRMREWGTGMVHYVPNGQINAVGSYSREYWRTLLKFHVPFGHDPNHILALLQKAVDTFKTPDGGWAETIRELYVMGGGPQKVNYELSALEFRICIEIFGEGGRPVRVVTQKVLEIFNEAGVTLAIPARLQFTGDDGFRTKVMSEAGFVPTTSARYPTSMEVSAAD